MTTLLRFLSPALVLGAVSFAPRAQAGIAACGDIHVEASANCEAKVGAACKAECKPVAFRAACAGRLQAECSTTCADPPELSCTGSCEGECQGTCTPEPAKLDCQGSCTGRCEGSCSGRCDAADDAAACEAQCQATCEGECGVSCEGTPPTATCEGKCQASCEGSCKADLNMDCQTTCQGEAFGECEAELVGGCEVQCDKPEGSVFCDGEYVDHGGNAKECVDALNAFLEKHVQLEGSAECSGNTCTAEGSAKATCAVSPTGRSGAGGLAGLALSAVVAGLALARRRR